MGAQPCGAPGLYVHVPFCVARCRYCAFASSVYDRAGAERYLVALAREAAGFGTWALGFGNGSCAESPKPKAESRPFATLYLGGGTPTVLPAELLERLCALPAIAAALRDAGERTVEANPGTVDAARLGLLRRAGFDRISLGAQSFDDAELALLGRVHRAGETAEAVRLARAAGFDNLGLDLIFGLPGQRPEGFLASLEAALRLAPEHVSLYGLTYEPGTPLAEEVKGTAPIAARHRYRYRNRSGARNGRAERKDFSPLRGSDTDSDSDTDADRTGTADGPRLRPCDEEAERDMYLAAVGRLRSAGYAHYEIANFALPGRESRHNLNYWAGGEYLGLGAGAASYLDGERRVNTGDVAEYCARVEAGRSPVESAERLGAEKRAREALMLGLRMTSGVDLAGFRARTGFDAQAIFGATLESHLAAGRIELASGRLGLTLEGLLVANAVMADFI
ncbi:MAG TPA: coproporphyrinogen-III oxidase family protein [Planctomycetota bacterium]|nr:coproporphyrinogen-III oxidase family protein [Planctomycetota bacterium]